jgi:hypothetical protein
MASQDQQLRNIATVARWRTLRNWLLGLGAAAPFSAVVVAGLGNSANPKHASSFFSVAAMAGMLSWAVLPLIAASFALFAAGAMAHGLSKWRWGEV